MEVFLANDKDVKEGETLEVDFAGRPAIVIRLDGKPYAFVNCCMHLGGPMVLAGKKLHCKWHGSEFDVATGKTLTGPAPAGSKLISLPIIVKDGKIFYSY